MLRSTLLFLLASFASISFAQTAETIFVDGTVYELDEEFSTSFPKDDSAFPFDRYTGSIFSWQLFGEGNSALSTRELEFPIGGRDATKSYNIVISHNFELVPASDWSEIVVELFIKCDDKKLGSETITLTHQTGIEEKLPTRMVLDWTLEAGVCPTDEIKVGLAVGMSEIKFQKAQIKVLETKP